MSVSLNWSPEVEPPRINILPRQIVNQIAAGEVLERPASAVKELLENALDAHATRIEIDLQAGGLELIRICDNGVGIHADDLPLAVTSHATSKLRASDDLFCIDTYGFRGEALASMAAVSRLTLRSRTARAVSGAELHVEFGEIRDVKSCGCAVGTTVELRELFGNLPVRRKFLKSPSSELSHVVEQFERVCLAHPEVFFWLRHQEKTVYQLPPTTHVLERLTTLFGQEFCQQLIPVEGSCGSWKLWGFVGHPQLNRPNRRQQFFYLNRRWIQDRTWQHALSEAYRGLLMVGRHPVAILFLEVPPQEVDVNVHPAKVEARFRDVQTLFRLTLSVLRTKFLSLDLSARLDLSGVPAPSTTTVQRPKDASGAHISHARGDGWLDELSDWVGPQPSMPSATAESSPAELSALTASDAALQQPSLTNGMHPGDDTGCKRVDKPRYPGGNTSSCSAPHAEISNPQQPARDDKSSPQSLSGSCTNPNPPNPQHTTQQQQLLSPTKPLKALQVHDCYLVVETEEGLTVIDQHALHERILYEQLKQRLLHGPIEAQPLLMPIPMTFSAREITILLEHRELLAQAGLQVEEFGRDTLLLTQHPILSGSPDWEAVLRDLADQLEQVREISREKLLDRVLQTMACRGAIKAGQHLSDEEMRTLLAQRHLIHHPHHCPHGRPTALTLTRAELDRQFGRLGSL